MKVCFHFAHKDFVQGLVFVVEIGSVAEIVLVVPLAFVHFALV